MRAAALIISVGMLHWLPAGRSAWIPGGVAFDPYQIKGQHAAAAAKEISQRKCSGKPAADGRFQSAQQETLVEYFRLHTDPDLPAPGSKDDGLPTAARKQPRVFCFAFFIGDHREQARALAETWMPRCDGALIHASVADPSVPTVRIPHDLAEEKESAHQMVRTYWKYIHDNYLDDFDYFLFGPEDYYTIVEHLREYLATEEIVGLDRRGAPLYIGRRFAQGGNANLIFNAEGAGYLLNRKALVHFMTNADQRQCSPGVQSPMTDVLLARCLRRSHPKVHAHDTKDAQGRERFHPFPPDDHVLFKETPKDSAYKKSWYETYSINVKYGWDCCSPASITFHRMNASMILDFDAALYRRCD